MLKTSVQTPGGTHKLCEHCVVIEVRRYICVEVHKLNFGYFAVLVLVELVKQLYQDLLSVLTSILVCCHCRDVEVVKDIVCCNAAFLSNSLPNVHNDFVSVAAQLASDASDKLFGVNETVPIYIEVSVHLLEL